MRRPFSMLANFAGYLDRGRYPSLRYTVRCLWMRWLISGRLCKYRSIEVFDDMDGSSLTSFVFGPALERA